MNWRTINTPSVNPLGNINWGNITSAAGFGSADTRTAFSDPAALGTTTSGGWDSLGDLTYNANNADISQAISGFNLPSTASPDAEYGWGNFFGKDGKAGHAGLALGAMQGLSNFYLGMKQYGLAKDTLAENKKQFNLNYSAQQKLTNSQLADRQTARAIGAGAGQTQYESTADYMKKYGV